MNANRRAVLGLGVKSLLSASLLFSLPAEGQGDRPQAEAFELKLALNTPITPAEELTIGLSVNQPFDLKSAPVGGAFNAVSGMLLPREKGGKYPLVLTLFYYGSEKANLLETSYLHLELDKPVGGGASIASMAYPHTIILSKINKR